MTRQNRVNPFGELLATPARGTLMGNRGVLHNAQGQIVRHFQGRRWISCLLAFKGRGQWPDKRPLMQPNHYTELFFLDEATALAAGHRPCMECQRTRFLAFRAAWVAANPHLATSPQPKVAEIDSVLHQERVAGKRQKVTYTAPLGDLPDGTFILLAAQPYLVLGDWLLPWSPDGYGVPADQQLAPATVTILTPRSIVAALAHGYRPNFHPSTAV